MSIVEVIVEYSAENLSAHIEGVPVTVSGKDIAEVEQRMGEAVALYVESCRQTGTEFDERLAEDYDLQFRIDAATFINYYSNIFTKAALSRITGINERQLWHYAAGMHKPRKRQLEKIQNGINALTEELQSVSLV